MKILRIIARLNVGGPARHVVWLTQQLNGDGFESVLIAGTVPKGEESMNYLAEEHGVKPVVHRRDEPRAFAERSHLADQDLSRDPSGATRHHPHSHGKGGNGRTCGRASLQVVDPRPRRSVKVVHTFHGHVFHSYYGRGKTRLFITIEKLLGAFATDKIVVISPQQFHEIHETFGIGLGAQFEIIPLGDRCRRASRIRTKTRRQFRSEIGASDDEIVVGFVGRLTEIKDVSLYLRVADIVRREIGDAVRVRFVVVGDGHMRAELERQARELGLGDTVQFLGNRTDTEVIYSGLDIVALTSLNEGTPLSLIEAMAAGRPVISTAVGGVRDLLGETVEQHDGFRVCERGIAIDGRSPAEYAKGLIYLAKNEKLRERLAETGHFFVNPGILRNDWSTTSSSFT